jgi:flagellar assembly factor FliW
MPFGLLGFEQLKNFTLVTNPEEEPFVSLQAVEEPKLAFLVMSPFVVVPDYLPEIPEEDDAGWNAARQRGCGGSGHDL